MFFSGARLRRTLSLMPPLFSEQETSKEKQAEAGRNIVLRWRLLLAEFIFVSALVVVLVGAGVGRGVREATARFL